MAADVRQRSFGQDRRLSPVDRAGIWLSDRRIRGAIGPLLGKTLADIGCGFNATLGLTLLPEVEHLTLLDVSLAPILRELPKVTAIEGVLPDALHQLESESIDALICNSVLEHVWEPVDVLREFRRILSRDGVCFVNVPSWRGKSLLELSAFRFGLSPAAEMDDHKSYYDPRDLWPLLVRAGFRPRHIVCRRHKFSLNTFAICRKSDGKGDRGRSS